MLQIALVFGIAGATLAAFGPFASVVLRERGFSPAEIGLLAALAAVAYSVAVPAWGHVGDAVVGRARAARLSLVVTAVAFGLFLLPLPPVLLAAAYVAWAGNYGAVTPLIDALAVNALRDPGREYGQVRAVTSAGFAATAIVAGLAYGAFGYGPAGPAWLVLAALLAILAGRLPDLGRARLAEGRRGGAIGEAFAVQPRLPGILLAIGIVHVGMFTGFTFLGLRIVDLGGGAELVALSSAVSAAVEIGVMMAAGRLVPRLGLRAMFSAGAALQGVSFLLWAVLTSPELIVLSRLVSGVGFALLYVAIVFTMRAILPADLQGTGQALFGVVASGVAAFLANVVGGLAYGTVGPGILFGSMAVLALGAVAAGWRTFPRALPRETPGVPAEPLSGAAA